MSINQNLFQLQHFYSKVKSQKSKVKNQKLKHNSKFRKFRPQKEK